MAFDVFISYASKDKIVADAVCARLESAGIRCWIAPRDILPGTSYGEAIIEAIHGAKAMVLVFSSNANSSGHIPKEVERAVSNGVPIIPFRIEDVMPGKSLDYFIGSVHWLDAMTPPMEKHLDDLATTIHKLLPEKTGEQRMPPPPVLDKVQQVPPAAVAPTPPKTPIRSAPNTETTRPPSSRAIWIAIAAVVFLVVVVLGVVLFRTGNGQQSKPGMADVAQPPDSNSSNGHAKMPQTETRSITVDPIVGCYQWFNNAPVVIHRDGTIVGGPFTGHWRRLDASRRAYTFAWPVSTDTVTISADQRSLSGANQYGYPASGVRMAGNSGLVGTWRWPNGVPVIVSPNGTFSAATFMGKWQALDASRGLYTLSWPGPVDSVTLTADGSRISGANQYGIKISGVRTQPCATN